MKLVKKLLEKKLLAIAIVGFIFSILTISYFIFQNYHHNNNLIASASQLASAYQEKIDVDLSIDKSPVRLKIPVINIDANVEQVALTSDGLMDAPKGPSEVGWYSLGPRPGEIGNAVMDGHSGWKGGIKAVFDDLYKLEIGDKIYIESEDNVFTTFVVKKISKYSPDTDATNVFISNDGKSHLNLITCTGFWDNILKSHSSRLVIFADKED